MEISIGIKEPFPKTYKDTWKKTIKISLKTNKISTALVRSKLQSAEHKKMFNNLLIKNLQ